MNTLRSCCGLWLVSTIGLQGQILLSGGLNYSQNFDSLACVSIGATVPWADNTTLPGWYASRAHQASGGAYGPYPYVSYRVSGGDHNDGWIYSFGTNGVNPITERAFGSVSSSLPGTNAWGVRFQNNTTNLLGQVMISYTGEQWRNGGNANTQTMYFTYRTSASPIPDPTPGNESAWTPFPALNFNTPATGTTALPVDGNAPYNRTIFSNVLLPGVLLNPGDEIFLRWHDINDVGNDHGFGVDDLTVSFSIVQPMFISNCRWETGRMRFDLCGMSGQTAVVQATTNWLNWVSLSTNSLSSTPTPFSDPQSPAFPSRFYRLRTP